MKIRRISVRSATSSRAQVRFSLKIDALLKLIDQVDEEEEKARYEEGDGYDDSD